MIEFIFATGLGGFEMLNILLSDIKKYDKQCNAIQLKF